MSGDMEKVHRRYARLLMPTDCGNNQYVPVMFVMQFQKRRQRCLSGFPILYLYSSQRRNTNKRLIILYLKALARANSTVSGTQNNAHCDATTGSFAKRLEDKQLRIAPAFDVALRPLAQRGMRSRASWEYFKEDNFEDFISLLLVTTRC
jgi:hypothetical protein